jgi:hypothetical protein
MRRLHRVLRREVISRGSDLASAHFLAQHPGSTAADLVWRSA